jgi:hypothetical protein
MSDMARPRIEPPRFALDEGTVSRPVFDTCILQATMVGKVAIEIADPAEGTLLTGEIDVDDGAAN